MRVVVGWGDVIKDDLKNIASLKLSEYMRFTNVVLFLSCIRSLKIQYQTQARG